MDAIRFFTEHRIDYVTAGPNVGRGHVAIRCPWCGRADPSHHMSVRLDMSAFMCWRDRSHSGYSPIRLVATLLKIRPGAARRLLGMPAQSGADPGAFDALVADPDQIMAQRKQGNGADSAETPQITLPQSMRPLCSTDPFAQRFMAYMQERNLPLGKLIQYRLRYAVAGPWKNRIVIPVYGRGNCLQTVIGRSIYPDASLRYKALSTDPKQAALDGFDHPAPRATTDCLLGYDWIEGTTGKVLFVVEGPFDAMAVTVRAIHNSSVATCLFTTSISPIQIDEITNMARWYDRVVVMLDEGAEAQAFRVTSNLAHLDPVCHLIEGDPA